MERERKEELDEMLKESLDSSVVEIKRAGVSIPFDCYYESDVMGTDRCFGYESRGTLKLFQIAPLTDNKNLSGAALSAIDFDDESLLKDLILVGQQIIAEEPTEIRNLKDLSTEIEIEGYYFTMTYQSPRVKIIDKTLFENYANRVIKRNSI